MLASSAMAGALYFESMVPPGAKRQCKSEVRSAKAAGRSKSEVRSPKEERSAKREVRSPEGTLRARRRVPVIRCEREGAGPAAGAARRLSIRRRGDSRSR